MSLAVCAVVYTVYTHMEKVSPHMNEVACSREEIPMGKKQREKVKCDDVSAQKNRHYGKSKEKKIFSSLFGRASYA